MKIRHNIHYQHIKALQEASFTVILSEYAESTNAVKNKIR